MNKKACIIATLLLFVLIVPISASATSYDYRDAYVQIQSTGFVFTNINGTHKTIRGYGHDDEILLWGQYPRSYHEFTVVSHGKEVTFHGFHLKVTIDGFTGWMTGQLHRSFFGKYPFKLSGDCDLIHINVCRG